MQLVMSKFNFELNCHIFANFELECLRSVQPDVNLNAEVWFSIQTSKFSSKRRLKRRTQQKRVRGLRRRLEHEFAVRTQTRGSGGTLGVGGTTWEPSAPSPGCRDVATTGLGRRRPLMLLLLLARGCQCTQSSASGRDREGGGRCVIRYLCCCCCCCARV